MNDTAIETLDNILFLEDPAEILTPVLDPLFPIEPVISIVPAEPEISIDSIPNDLIPKIYGTPGDDTITGTDNGEYIYGLEGNDFIRAGNGGRCYIRK